MSHISRLPLPSISLVLTTDHTRIPHRPSVVKVAPVKVAPLPHPPTKVYSAHFDPMKTIHPRDPVPQPPEEEHHSQKKHIQRQHVVFVEEVESLDFTLAESIHEFDTKNERVGVGKAVKRKISSVLSSARTLLCIELPYACFCRVSRQ